MLGSPATDMAREFSSSSSSSMVAAAFTVSRREPELIVPAKPTMREFKNLSDIDDQEGLRFQIPFIMFYGSHASMAGKEKDPVKIIRDSLPRALEVYYPLAGRLVEGPNRKLIVDCNDEGILFIEADADTTIDELRDSMVPPCPYVDQFLYQVPGSEAVLGCPLLLIQVTRLACGGFVLAIRLNHALCDSLGLVKFLHAVAEIAGGATSPSLSPVWDRHILSARHPPRVTCVHHEFEDVTRNNTTKFDRDYQDNMVHRSFFFGPSELQSIRRHLPQHLRSSSNFEIITACVWRCRTVALDLDPNDVVSISCANNLRIRSNKRRTSLSLQLPLGYYGNAFAFPTALSKAKRLHNNPLGYALQLVKKAKAQMNEEYAQSVADLMVIKGRPHYASTIWNLIVSDLTRVGLGDIDFGWGEAVYGGPVGSSPDFTLYCRSKNGVGEDGVLVPIWLPLAAMDKFREELLKLTHHGNDFDTYEIVYPKIASML